MKGGKMSKIVNKILADFGMVLGVARIEDEIRGTKDELCRLSNRISILEQENSTLQKDNEMLKQTILDLHYNITQESIVIEKPVILEERFSIEECYKRLEQEAPRAFGIYKELINYNQSAYVGEPVDSCSVKGHVQGNSFRKFARRYLGGYVLDIGCGPQDVPLYLEDCELQKIYGLDPLPPSGKHPFVYEQGIGEFIPWCDNSFDCVIFATSLDHVFLLDKVLSETKRVCRNSGKVLFWVSFDENAVEYNPYDPNFEAYDSFHMFHHSKEQYEKDMGKFFECIEYFQSGENTHFYAFEVRK